MTKLTAIKRTPIIDGWLILFFAIAAISLYGMVQVFLYGQEASYGLSREVPWGLLIIGYSFFIDISLGMALIGIFAHVFKFEAFNIMAKKVVWLSMIALPVGMFLIFWDLAGPYRLQVLRFVENYFNFKLTSPIWWMATFYTLEFPLLILEVYFLLKKETKYTFYAGIIGFILGITAFSTLSFVFAANGSIPFWHGAYMPMFFIVSSLALGAAITLILIYIYRYRSGGGLKEHCLKSSKVLSKMLFFVLMIMIFAKTWKFIITLYTGNLLLVQTGEAIIKGPLSFNFWFFEVGIGLLIPFLILLLSRFKSIRLSVLAGILTIIGVFFSRYDLVIGGQIIPKLSAYFPKTWYTHYTPSLAELSFFIGAIGICLFLFLLGERLLNLRKE